MARDAPVAHKHSIILGDETAFARTLHLRGENSLALAQLLTLFAESEAEESLKEGSEEENREVAVARGRRAGGDWNCGDFSPPGGRGGGQDLWFYIGYTQYRSSIPRS